MYFSRFLFGPIRNMEWPALKWWNSKRLEYNIKLLLCLIIAQFLLAMVAISTSTGGEFDFVRRLLGAIITDIVILALVNVFYFLMPVLELVFFRKINILYRKYSFALLNILNLVFILVATVMLFVIKL